MAVQYTGHLIYSTFKNERKKNNKKDQFWIVRTILQKQSLVYWTYWTFEVKKTKLVVDEQWTNEMKKGERAHIYSITMHDL